MMLHNLDGLGETPKNCELHRVFVTTQTAGVQIHNVCRGHLGRNVIFSVGIQYDFVALWWARQ